MLCSVVYRTLTLKDPRYGEVFDALVCSSRAQRPAVRPSLGSQALTQHLPLPSCTPSRVVFEAAHAAGIPEHQPWRCAAANANHHDVRSVFVLRDTVSGKSVRCDPRHALPSAPGAYACHIVHATQVGARSSFSW